MTRSWSDSLLEAHCVGGLAVLPLVSGSTAKAPMRLFFTSSCNPSMLCITLALALPQWPKTPGQRCDSVTAGDAPLQATLQDVSCPACESAASESTVRTRARLGRGVGWCPTPWATHLLRERMRQRGEESSPAP